MEVALTLNGLKLLHYSVRHIQRKALSSLCANKYIVTLPADEGDANVIVDWSLIKSYNLPPETQKPIIPKEF